ncbi:hypothetical protein GGR51DRAFT_500395 [Nemania sp. FL0031]|nr:hypothetical protein GGR51DRAFT_500395 [Nemania sp. FL0031]
MRCLSVTGILMSSSSLATSHFARLFYITKSKYPEIHSDLCSRYSILKKLLTPLLRGVNLLRSDVVFLPVTMSRCSVTSRP